jgi:hypothetical protein
MYKSVSKIINENKDKLEYVDDLKKIKLTVDEILLRNDHTKENMEMLKKYKKRNK